MGKRAKKDYRNIIMDRANLGLCPICGSTIPESNYLILTHEGIDINVCNGHWNVLAHSARVKFTYEEN